jgi:lysophospholipase L1-like esterase
MGQDYAYLLAAEIGAESPQRELVFVNRGISGNRVPDLEARWQTDTIALHPQMLSILIGVNDLLATGDRAVTLEEYEAGYDRLLAETVAALPGTKIVLGEPFLLPVGKQQAAYAENLAGLKKRQAAVDRRSTTCPWCTISGPSMQRWPWLRRSTGAGMACTRRMRGTA